MSVRRTPPRPTRPPEPLGDIGASHATPMRGPSVSETRDRRCSGDVAEVEGGVQPRRGSGLVCGPLTPLEPGGSPADVEMASGDDGADVFRTQAGSEGATTGRGLHHVRGTKRPAVSPLKEVRGGIDMSLPPLSDIDIFAIKEDFAAQDKLLTSFTISSTH